MHGKAIKVPPTPTRCGLGRGKVAEVISLGSDQEGGRRHWVIPVGLEKNIVPRESHTRASRAELKCYC